jgi:DNA replication protein DnaC
MLIHQTKEKLIQMKMAGICKGLEEQQNSPSYQDMSFEQRLGLLVDKEFQLRENRRHTKRLREAKLRLTAQVEDVDYQAPRGLDKSFYLELAAGNWIQGRHNLIINGPTGCGKTFLACALANKSIRDGLRCMYYHFPELLSELAIKKAEGSFQTMLKNLDRRELLIIDDWLREEVTADQAKNILDLFEKRFRTKSVLLTTQIPVSDWHERFKDPTLADAILDRIVHDSYRINLQGDSMRKRTAKLT